MASFPKTLLVTKDGDDYGEPGHTAHDSFDTIPLLKNREVAEYTLVSVKKVKVTLE